MTAVRAEGFEPFFSPDSRLLILGSFPSVRSRAEGFYYGNPQNRFWKVVAAAYNAGLPRTVAEKKALLSAHRIALWDVVASCEIVGSMDKTIRNYRIADLYRVLHAADIRTIALNGKTALAIFRERYPALEGISVVLPSTSPANGRFDAQPWLKLLTTNR